MVAVGKPKRNTLISVSTEQVRLICLAVDREFPIEKRTDALRAIRLLKKKRRKDNGVPVSIIIIGAILSLVFCLLGNRYYGNSGAILGIIVGVGLAIPIALGISWFMKIKKQRNISRLIAKNPAHWRPIFEKAKKILTERA